MDNILFYSVCYLNVNKIGYLLEKFRFFVKLFLIVSKKNIYRTSFKLLVIILHNTQPSEIFKMYQVFDFPCQSLKIVIILCLH